MLITLRTITRKKKPDHHHTHTQPDSYPFPFLSFSFEREKAKGGGSQNAFHQSKATCTGTRARRRRSRRRSRTCRRRRWRRIPVQTWDVSREPGFHECGADQQTVVEGVGAEGLGQPGDLLVLVHGGFAGDDHGQAAGAADVRVVFDGVDDHGLVGDGADGEDVVVGAGAGVEDGVVDGRVAEGDGFGGAGEVGGEHEVER